MKIAVELPRITILPSSKNEFIFLQEMLLKMRNENEVCGFKKR